MKARRRRTLTIINVISIIGIVVAVVAVMMPLYAGETISPVVTCTSNLKQLSFGILLYTGDNDNRLPPRDTWFTNAMQYIDDPMREGRSKGKTPAQFRCPTVVKSKMPGIGYSFNSSIEMKNIEKLPYRDKVVMIFESINYAPNASDPVVSLPNPPRHRNRNLVAHPDGHVSDHRP